MVNGSILRSEMKAGEIVSEKQIERACIDLYRKFGCSVVEFSQPHRARGQTRGIADLRVYMLRTNRGAPKFPASWWHEIKRPGGKQSPGQVEFQRMVESFGEEYVVGGANAAIRQLNKYGFSIAELPE